MEQHDRHDLRINGSGSASGGLYNSITVNGDGSIHGNVDYIELKINGHATISGNATGRLGVIRGQGTIKGNLQAEQLKISGQGLIHGNACVKVMRVDGDGEIRGGYTGEELKVYGSIKIGEDCNSDSFMSKGAFKIAGMLNADNVDISLYGSCKVKEIGGGRIQVRQNPVSGLTGMLKSLFFSGGFAELTCEIIEGDDIYLENTRANVVRGNRVEIGPGCTIGLVEYTEAFQQAGGAQVKEQRKI